ncbi:MAG: hypothetical protein J0M19_15225 [Sphingomonadales bacterium]|nr:hypothetical protein [Sphingomonadales bacterium]
MKFPFANQFITTGAGAAYRLSLPAGAAAKAANQAMTALVFFRIPPEFHENAYHRILLARGNGGTGSGECYLRVKANADPIDLTYQVKTGTTVHASGTISGLPKGKDFVAGVVINPAYVHVFIAATDGSYLQQANVATTGAYTNSMTSPQMFDHIGSSGGGSNRPWYGPIENVCFISGTFPEVSGQADATLIANIASGAQSLETLHTLFTGGAKVSRYPLLTHTDLSDLWELAGALTEVNVDNPGQRRAFPGGPVRPMGLYPARTRDQVSQCVFASVGDISTAAGTVKVEGGTFSTSLFPTLATVRARLVGVSTGTVWRDWTPLTTNVGAGTWAAADFANVPAKAEFMALQFAGFDSTGAMITRIICSHGMRGVGFCAINSGQSQLMYLWANGGAFTVPNGLNLVTTIQEGTLTSGVESAVNNYQRVINPYMNAGVGIARGMLQLAVEINTLFPGYPIQLMTVGKSGEPINRLSPISVNNPSAGGSYYYNRWQRLAEALGVIPPHYLQLVGHSSGSDSTYRVIYEEMVAEAISRFGNPIKVLPVDVPRYSGAGTSANYNQVQAARRLTREWIEDNAEGYHGPSFGCVQTSEGGSSDPHPSNDDAGQGRTGGLMAWHILAAARAVEDVIVAPVAARTVAASNKLFVEIGAIN